MHAIVKLYSIEPYKIEQFLTHFFKDKNFNLKKDTTQWQMEYPNPIELVDIIGVYIENIDTYNISMWISIDNGVFIKVTPDNSDELIRYLYERFPY